MKSHRRKYEKRNRQIKKIKFMSFIIILILLVISLITVLARYVTNSINNYLMESKEFYFYSDKLKEDGQDYQIDNWSGVEDYTITINMNSMENNLKKASYDIPYSITYNYSDNIICQINKEEGIIYSSTNSDYFTIKVTPNKAMENGDKAWVEIYAKSDAEYKKELKAKFTFVVGKENVTYEIDDEENSSYFELNITNTQSYYMVSEAFDSYTVGQRIDVNTYLSLSDENKKKCYSGEITIKFDPTKVQIDMTDKNYLKAKNIKQTNVNGYNYINELTINVDALSSENIRFYKVDKTQNYTYPIDNKECILNISIK